MDLSQLPALDQHAHNVLTPEAAARRPYVAAFTEAHHPAMLADHAPQTLCYRRSLRDVAALLDCPAEEQAILDRRARMGLEELTRRCLRQARLEAILLDDGFLPGEILPVAWHARFVPASRLLRIEALAEELLARTAGFDDLVDQFRSRLAPPPRGVVGLKSIAAYRTGLDLAPGSTREAAASFQALRSQAAAGPVRLADRALLSFLLVEALTLAARHGLPLQLHTGFGDPDLDLRLANPLHLRPFLEDPRFRGVPLVLLHASYPFVREAAYLASVYPQVYVDVGLAVPYLSVAGMREVFRQLLELAPTSKVLYSSDAHFLPELFYLGALHGRRALGAVLGEAIRDGDLTATQAEHAAAAILAGNARQLYFPGAARR